MRRRSCPGVLDTAFSQVTSGRVAQGASFTMANTGVPFLFIDRNVRNSLRYFYAVTAFDVNSLVSGPSSLESARVTKQVIPAPAPTNQQVAANLVTHVIGNDGVAMDTIITGYPSFNAATGQFGGPFPPADGGVIGFVGEFAASIIQPSQSGALTLRLDDIELGVYGNIGAVFGGVSGISAPAIYHVTVGNGVEEFEIAIPHNQVQFGGGGANGAAAVSTGVDETPAFFEALVVDPATARRFEGSGDFRLQGQATIRTGPGQEAGAWGVGARFSDFGTPANSKYNGSRWFDGPSPTANETVANPQLNNCTPNRGRQHRAPHGGGLRQRGDLRELQQRRRADGRDHDPAGRGVHALQRRVAELRVGLPDGAPRRRLQCHLGTRRHRGVGIRRDAQRRGAVPAVARWWLGNSQHVGGRDRGPRQPGRRAHGGGPRLRRAVRDRTARGRSRTPHSVRQWAGGTEQHGAAGPGGVLPEPGRGRHGAGGGGRRVPVLPRG